MSSSSAESAEKKEGWAASSPLSPSSRAAWPSSSASTALSFFSMVRVRRLAWEDEWEGVEAADLAICSRAMDFGALRFCLEKLDRYAKKRCFLVLHSGGSYLGPDVMGLMERPLHPRADYIYAVAMLYQMGVRAEVRFLRSDGGMRYATAEEFVESVKWRVGGITESETEKLEALYARLPRDEEGRAMYSHPFTWAVLTWEKGEAWA